jgi:putative effector of murein hydrolase LrgA (UPF0299 family)
VEGRAYWDKISGWAGAIVALCLFGGLAAQYPYPAKIIGIILLLTWSIAKFIEWKWGG